MPNTKLLLTTDLSDESLAAFPVAGRLAAALDASVTVVTVLDLDPQLPPGVIGLSAPREARFREEVTTRVQQHLNEMVSAKLDDDLTVETRIVEDQAPARAICELAAEGDYGMIVTATHGRSGVARMVLGSVAERIARRAARPVVLVPVAD